MTKVRPGTLVSFKDPRAGRVVDAIVLSRNGKGNRAKVAAIFGQSPKSPVQIRAVAFEKLRARTAGNLDSRLRDFADEWKREKEALRDAQTEPARTRLEAAGFDVATLGDLHAVRKRYRATWLGVVDALVMEHKSSQLLASVTKNLDASGLNLRASKGRAGSCFTDTQSPSRSYARPMHRFGERLGSKQTSWSRVSTGVGSATPSLNCTLEPNAGPPRLPPMLKSQNAFSLSFQSRCHQGS